MFSRAWQRLPIFPRKVHQISSEKEIALYRASAPGTEYTSEFPPTLRFNFSLVRSLASVCGDCRTLKNEFTKNSRTYLCSTIFVLGIVFHNAASSLGDFSSCNSVDITKNLSLITLAACPLIEVTQELIFTWSYRRYDLLNT